MPLTDAQDVWTTCAASIRHQVSDAVWQTTFAGAHFVGIDDGNFVISVPSLLVKERIEGRYLFVVRDALVDAGGADLTISIVVDTPVTFIDDEGQMVLDLRDPEPANVASPQVNPSSEPPVPAHPGSGKFTFETFVIGKSNSFAHAAAQAVAERPARSYNPLFIYGGAGLGKTHLLQAIQHYVNAHYPSYHVRYVSTETFLNEFIDAIRNHTQIELKRRYRDIDVLLVDDIQFIEGKESFQEEFFHTFNSLYQENRQIVLSSDRPPDSMATLEDRLRSRFKMGLMTDIEPPDLETRMAILRKKSEAEARPINEEVVAFIAENVTDNIRALEGALTRVTAYANLTGQVLTIELARHALADIVGIRQARPITPALILEKTSEMFDFTVEELKGASRRRPLVTARQIAMYVFRELTDLSFPNIAKEFGGRDHTTVMHACEKIGKLMSERRQIYEQVTELIQTIKSGD